MISFRNLSIPRKIVAISMIISGAALLLASGALIAYDFSGTRRDLRASATVFGRIVADNTTAAVSFNDPLAAVETLNSFRAEPSIIASCIYTFRGLFAQYVVAGATPCPDQPALTSNDNSIVLVSTPIQLN